MTNPEPFVLSGDSFEQERSLNIKNLMLALEGGTPVVATNQDLSGVDLIGKDLSGCIFSGSNLYGANLYGADLSDADFTGANLSKAILRGASLFDAIFTQALFVGADLSHVENNMRCRLLGANLSGANMIWSDWNEGSLEDADLTCADLMGASFEGGASLLKMANLQEIKANLLQTCSLFHRDLVALMLKEIQEGVFRSSGLSAGNARPGRLYQYLSNSASRAPWSKFSPTYYQVPIVDREMAGTIWLRAIDEGDAPKTNPIAEITAEWLEEIVEDPELFDMLPEHRPKFGLHAVDGTPSAD